MERRELIRQALPAEKLPGAEPDDPNQGFLTVAPGRSGVRGFQISRVVDAWKLTEMPVDFTMRDVDVEVGEQLAELTP